MDMQFRERELASDYDRRREEIERDRLSAGEAPSTDSTEGSGRLGGMLVGGALGAVAGVLVGGPPGALVGGAVGAAAGAVVGSADEGADAVEPDRPALYADEDAWAEMGEERRK